MTPTDPLRTARRIGAAWARRRIAELGEVRASALRTAALTAQERVAIARGATVEILALEPWAVGV